MTGTKRRRQQRGWLVRIDPQLWIDVPFNRRLARSARFAYLDSLFHLASTDGPSGIYPATAATDYNLDEVAVQLATFGLWTDHGLGFTVSPYLGCRVVPDGRSAISRPLRRAVFARDGHQCVLCGCTRDLTLDHIHPWSLNGPDTYENLRVLCRPCNSRKGAKI